jgi:DNA-directed RNA polymerase subunit RPC12/RpoP
MWIALVATILVAGAGRLVLCLARRRQAVHHVFRCPACGQKIRYAAARAGTVGGCPRCWKKVTLPATPQPIEKDISGYRYHRPVLAAVRKSPRSQRYQKQP